MEHISSYPEVLALGHKMILEIFNGPVLVEEKIDGSQFSFGVINGELIARSKGKQLVLEAPEKMFDKAVEVIQSIKPQLTDGWMYRCEYLQKPKHNTLVYDRIPASHLIVFDIDNNLQSYLTYDEKLQEAHRIGLEVVPRLFEGVVENKEMFEGFLNLKSVLGNTTVEGVVIKNYDLITTSKKIAIGKYVSEKFKEVHEGDWKLRNPGRLDVIQKVIEEYSTEARYNKGIQHLRDRGELKDDLPDIGPLIKEVSSDVNKECEDEIKDKLYKAFWPQIQRGIVKDIPQWYKDQLAARAFSEK